MEYQPKSNEKSHNFYIAFQVSKVLLVKIYKIQPTVLFFSCCFTLVFTSGEISFHKLFFKIIWKKDFWCEFFCLGVHSNPPHPLNSQSQLSMTIANTPYNLNSSQHVLSLSFLGFHSSYVWVARHYYYQTEVTFASSYQSPDTYFNDLKRTKLGSSIWYSEEHEVWEFGGSTLESMKVDLFEILLKECLRGQLSENQ